MPILLKQSVDTFESEWGAKSLHKILTEHESWADFGQVGNT